MRGILTALLLCIASSVYAYEINGRVVAIVDGDTIDVLDASNTQYRIRLSGIDAPESKQAFGQVSRKSLSDLVYNKPVQVIWHKLERHGRYLGKVIKNGEDMNLEQVRQGMAWFYRKYQNELELDDRLLYLRGEMNAQEHRYGLWKDDHPTPPWDFRHH